VLYKPEYIVTLFSYWDIRRKNSEDLESVIKVSLKFLEAVIKPKSIHRTALMYQEMTCP